MLTLNKIKGFNWDDGYATKSINKHAVSQAETEQVFFNDPILLLPDEKHSHKEPRYHAYGKSDGGRKLHVTFTLRQRGTLIRAISARDMHRKERLFYDQA